MLTTTPIFIYRGNVFMSHHNTHNRSTGILIKTPRRTGKHLLIGVAETSRNITTRDVCGEIHYLLEDSKGFRTHQHGHENDQTYDAKMVTKVTKLAANLVAKNDANLALPPRFCQVLIESPL
ncbi:hypothetical protein TNCV_5084091 [Trichonephila clavipes]|nr:hypothetical protein TNCV_5084091 [Trichonephila clavipes]